MNAFPGVAVGIYTYASYSHPVVATLILGTSILAPVALALPCWSCTSSASQRYMTHGCPISSESEELRQAPPAQLCDYWDSECAILLQICSERKYHVDALCKLDGDKSALCQVR